MPKGSGLTKPLKLSPELAVICEAKKGENLARPEVVKRLWAYIKKNKLQVCLEKGPSLKKITFIFYLHLFDHKK